MQIIWKKHWRDVLLAALLGFVFALVSYQGSNLVPHKVLQKEYFDKWFDGDIPRVYANMAERVSPSQDRVRSHPLFLLAVHPAVFLFKKIFGLSPTDAVKWAMALLTFSSTIALFVLIRVMGCRRLDSVLICLLGGVSAAGMFWFTVPETFPFGALSILLALLIVPLSQGRLLSPVWYIAINIMTFGFTITNWMAGIFATAVTNPLRRATHIVVYSFAAVTLLWGVQKAFYREAGFFIGGRFDYWNLNNYNSDSGGALFVAGSMFYHTLIMPAIQMIVDPCTELGMRTQLSIPGSATIWGAVAAALWTILLVGGLKSLFYMNGQKGLRIVLGLLLLCQLVLHIIYGDETFIYSPHFLAILLPFAALNLLSKARKIAVVLITLLVPCVLINNVIQFEKSVEFINSADPRGPLPDTPECRH